MSEQQVVAVKSPMEYEGVWQATQRIHRLGAQASASVILIGKELIEVKSILGHGLFLQWLEEEFAWSARTAQRFMLVAEQFGDDPDGISHLSSRVLYALAAPSTPEEVREDLVERAKAGERVTSKDVEEAKSSANAIPVEEWESEAEDAEVPARTVPVGDDPYGRYDEEPSPVTSGPAMVADEPSGDVSLPVPDVTLIEVEYLDYGEGYEEWSMGSMGDTLFDFLSTDEVRYLSMKLAELLVKQQNGA